MLYHARKNWFWYPFDDSRVLCDPYTTYRGLGDPRGCFKVIPGPYFRVYSVHIVIQSNLVCFGLLKTDFDTHLTIQEASKTLISNTTNRGLGKPGEITSFKVSPGQYFRIYSVTTLLYNQILYVWGMYKLIIWHPFDNYTSLPDPYTTERGHKRPREFISKRLLVHISGYVVFQ